MTAHVTTWTHRDGVDLEIKAVAAFRHVPQRGGFPGDDTLTILSLTLDGGEISESDLTEAELDLLREEAAQCF